MSETDLLCKGYCLAIVRNIIGNTLAAEECYNDALEALWDAIPPAEPSNLAAYAAKTVRNICINRLRSSNAQKRISDALPLHEIEDCLPSPDETSETDQGKRERISLKLRKKNMKHQTDILANIDDRFISEALELLSEKPAKKIGAKRFVIFAAAIAAAVALIVSIVIAANRTATYPPEDDPNSQSGSITTQKDPDVTKPDQRYGDFTVENGVLLSYSGTDTDVTVPDGVTTISASSFENCVSLSRFTLNEDILTVKMAFVGCPALKYITMSNEMLLVPEDEILVKAGDTETVYGVLPYARVGELVIPEGYTAIAPRAFQYFFYNGDEDLEKLVLPSTMKTVGERAFGSYRALREIDLGGTETIMAGAFEACYSLERVVFGDALVSR